MMNSFSHLLKWLGDRRDGFLVGSAGLYSLGYLVWSYNAWRNNLGQLPALEFQYLIAGIVPAFIIAVAWTGITLFSRASDTITTLYKRHIYLPLLISLVTIAIQFIPILFQFGPKLGWIHTDWTSEQIYNYTVPLFILSMYLAAVTKHSGEGKFFRVFREVYGYLLSLFFCWYSMTIYFDLYPNLPQELGGPEPRCAYVDLVQEETSLSTLSKLVPINSSEGTPYAEIKVVRSRKLDVYFSSNDYLLVRIADNDNTYGSINPIEAPLYELPKEVIRVIEWCK